MSRKCSECGTILSSYNAGRICFVCQKKRQMNLHEKLAFSTCREFEYREYLMGYRNSEPVRYDTASSTVKAGVADHPDKKRQAPVRKIPQVRIEVCTDKIKYQPRGKKLQTPVSYEKVTILDGPCINRQSPVTKIPLLAGL